MQPNLKLKRLLSCCSAFKLQTLLLLPLKVKLKRFGRTLGRRSDVKKAYVSLAAGQELDLEAAAAAADKE